MESFPAGTLAGAGCFRCQTCGFAVALHECDAVPACPNCGGADFKRSSIFGDRSLREPVATHPHKAPEWLREARAALEPGGRYLAYDEAGHIRVVELSSGWTRIGRSLSADLRFDDPTVSRRHALVSAQEAVVRILDDRSLNGVFVNGDRVDLRELADGDEIAVGRFHLWFIALGAGGGRRPIRIGPSARALV